MPGTWSSACGWTTATVGGVVCRTTGVIHLGQCVLAVLCPLHRLKHVVLLSARPVRQPDTQPMFVVVDDKCETRCLATHQRRSSAVRTFRNQWTEANCFRHLKQEGSRQLENCRSQLIVCSLSRSGSGLRYSTPWYRTHDSHTRHEKIMICV
ncbi:hypothetical protein CBL_02131 [Carabus blaptoides fortunei]